MNRVNRLRKRKEQSCRVRCSYCGDKITTTGGFVKFWEGKLSCDKCINKAKFKLFCESDKPFEIHNF